MREEGTVVDVEGRLARVRMKPGAQCGRCCACSALGGGDRELEVETDLPLLPGSRVLVEIPRGNPWLSSLLLFVLPLAGLVAGVIVGAQWGGGDAAPLLLGFGLLVALFAMAAIIDKTIIRKRQKPPAIVEVLGPDT
ncbi:MAG TPA: SoxR reducing system RseC family protein [Planctomycetota bacterium]|nr:SoxR reducing system RseC family protein [Planctomycetota bacterium]